MSGIINLTDEDSRTSFTSLTDELQPISIYILWRSNIDEDFKIQALFGKTLKYELEPVEKFRTELKSEIIVYRLKYQMLINNNEYTKTSNENNNSTMNKYQLRLSTRALNIPTHYDDSKQRIMDIDNSYQFLFDVHFQNNILPSRGIQVEFWSKLCLYTYFLIKNNMYDKFTCLIQQFNNELNMDTNKKLTQYQLEMFIYTSYTYLPQINDYLRKDENAVKIFLQMFGILSIEKENFKFDKTTFSNLATEFYEYIKKHLNHLLQTLNEQDWQLLIQGLTIFMSVQMLGNQTIFDTFYLFELMNDYPEKQELIINFLLRRLVDLQIPIKNNNWTNLFSLVTDKYLLVHCLDLVTSLDDYLIVLQYVIKHNSVNEQMKIQLTNNFDKLISRSDFTISLENILCLLTYLQPEHRTTTCSSTENMHIFQLIITSSQCLRQKINTCLENLDINKISLEVLSKLLELDHAVSIITIDKTNYLIKTIVNNQNRTGHYYITWFICFLCDKYFKNNANDQQNFQRLLENWSNHIKNDRDMLPQIIVKLNTLLEHLQTVLINDNNDNRLQQFRENILDACFQPAVIYEILIDVCTKVTNDQFLHLYEKRFIDTLLMNNRNKLKSMEDPTNPLCHLLELSRKIDSTFNRLLTNLISACAKLINLNNEEIRYETFLHPSKKTCTYAVLFDQHLNDFNLVQGTLYQLDCLWNRWSYIGLTLEDINKWNEHNSEERTIFNKIWDTVRVRFNKQESINSIFKQAETEFSEKITTRQAIISALNAYCDKANDFSSALHSLKDMLVELHDKPIKSVQIPKDLQNIESIALKLHSLSTSQVWLKYYNQNLLKNDTQGSRSNLSVKSSVGPTSSNSASEDEDELSYRSLPVEIKSEKPSLPRQRRISLAPTNTNQLSRDSLTSVDILNNVQKIFEGFHRHINFICIGWEKEPIREWIQLFSDVQDVSTELEVITKNLTLTIPKELTDILKLSENRNFISHVCQGCLNLTTKLGISIKDDDLNVLKTLINLDENILGEICSPAYQEYLHQYVLHYSSNTLVVWSQFSVATELIDFIISISSADFDHLLENVNDGEDKLVSLKTVQDFQILKHYFDQVYKSIEQLKRDKHRFILPNILACFDNDGISNQLGSVQEFFTTCSNELPDIKQSHSELTDKEQSKRRLIIQIMNNSLIKFVRDVKFDILILPQNRNFPDLSELRDRARLIQYSYRNKMKKDDEYQIQRFELFIKFVSTIETVLNTLNSLYIAGHPIVYEVVLIKQEFRCYQNEFDSLIDFNQKLQETYLSWEKTLCEKYILYPELTYFSCEQFDIIEQFIYNKSPCDEEEHGYHLLKYIGLDPILIRQSNLTNERQYTPEDRLEKLGEILSKQRSTTYCLSQQNPMNKKIFLLETTDSGILKAILSLNNRFYVLPTANHLFYCTNETTWMQIRAFIYRCIYSQEFHQLIRPELLSIAIQDQIIHLLSQLLEKNPQHIFCLSIITTTSIVNLQLTDGLKSLQIVQIIHEQDLMNDAEFRLTLSDLIQKCTIVTSRITGLGKSHTIREECVKNRREYVKFPVNGDIQPDIIAERLLKEARNFQQGTIHFDIGVIDNYHQINDLINCLILFRSFCFGQTAISIPNETPIYIELDCSSHSNLMEHIILFQHIPSILIDQINWQKLVIRKSVKFVANYLKAIKDTSIKDKDVNVEKLININQDECVRLIQEYFFHNQNNDYITWTRVFIYISIFYNLFLGFSKCSYFISEHLEDTLRQSRMDVLQTFLRSASQFTSISVEAVRRQQRAANNNRNDIGQGQELSNAIIRWDDIQPFTFVFSPTNDPIFVYKTERNIPESLKKYFDRYTQKMATRKKSSIIKMLATKHVKAIFPDYTKLEHEEFFEKLANLSARYFLPKAICTKCFRHYEYDKLTCDKCSNTTDLLDRPHVPYSYENGETFRKKIATIIKSEYVLTADNYIKMLLVFVRVQSKVPVLIMGETGCGKTALINCLCQKILGDDLHVFRLHAGITNEKLIKEMNDLIIRAESLPVEKNLWVFFDEFNTIFNISLLKEIICERTLLGKNLPKNMVFLGTCNPRRQKIDRAISNENVGIKKDRYDTLKLLNNQQNFLYNVTSIPETMLEYIWDYGHLDQETEKTYIVAKLKTCENLADNPQIFEMVVELISESHKFLRKLEDISSVSLRDVARYCSLYKWFNQYLEDHVDPSRLVKDSSRLALLLCYYFRLDSRKKKQDYINSLDTRLCTMYGLSKLTFVKSFEKLLEREENRLINQMQIPSDMARNRALKENLFVLFSCIINRIPVFLCGKPGASKTSAVQILMNNLKGSRSDNISFRKLPELVAVTFQGSQNCTSASIEQIFERAEKFMKQETNSSLLPVIIFDEIGLAELSVHNPLKVLHSHLEIEECRFGFVGISNWRLDASKMNRALYVACLDPDDLDLELTGSFLSNINSSLNKENLFDINIIRALAQAYFDLQNRMAKEHKNENYFGLRDYYSLIKGIAYDCEKYPQRPQYETIYQQLIINFGGINNGYDYIWEKFCSLIDRYDLLRMFQMPTPKELIQTCLINRNSRHSMLIVDRESTIDHVERFITTNPILNGSVKTLVGSQFEGDFVSNRTYTESYSTRVLMEIILHAETPITLVMRRMNHLYDNLYDLFNQNFAISGRKKYCRIALSSIYNPRCFVHDQFYCVILLNAKDVDISDPPFLNRFQKHYIQIDKLTQPRQWSLTSQLIDWLYELPLTSVNKDFLLLKHLVIPFSADYICDLVIDICQDDTCTDEIILNLCQKKLLRACSYDFLSVLSLNNSEDLIEQYYQIHYNLFNISQLISSTFEQSLPTKRIIYTYTHIYETIEYENIEQIDETKLNIIKTELDLINLLKSYNQNKTSSYIHIIRLDYHRENQHILSLKYNILNHWNELKDLHLWIIFHIQRNKLDQTKNDVLFNGWDVIMIDDLNNKKKVLSKEILLNPSYKNFLNQYQYRFLDGLFNDFIHRTLTKFRYENLSNEQQTERYNHLFNLLNQEENQYFRRILQETIEYLIKTISNPDEKRFQDWRLDLLSDNFISVTSRSFNEALQTIMISFYDTYFQLLMHHFECFNLIDSYIYFTRNYSDDLKDLWENCYKLSLNTIDSSIMNIKYLEIPLIDNLKLPYSNKEFKILKQLTDILQTQTIENDIDVELFIIKFLKQRSSYGEKLIDFIFNNNQLLELYYQDQLILFHMENKFQISRKFLLKLLTTNFERNLMTRLIQLIAYPDELADILRTLEDGLKLFNENILLEYMNKQILTEDSLKETPNSFYSIQCQDDKFHLVSPDTFEINDQFEFESLCDPFIEVTIMNLIEIIASSTLINQIKDIEIITAVFSSISQRVSKLSDYYYQVKNLEKLRSFMSLLRSIKTLNSSQTLEVFQKCSNDYKFDGTFNTCEEIDEFIQSLRRYINQSERKLDRNTIKTILLKLEVEFLKNWLVNNNDQFFNILKLINETENHLWKYSAKIFFHIVGELDLLENIEHSYDVLPENIDKINQLDTHLNIFKNSQFKIHRLFVNRIHLHLIFRFSFDNQNIKTYLNTNYENFQQSIEYISTFNLTISSEEYSHVQLIRVLAWLKFYTQLYSYSLVNNFKYQHLTDIDQYLTNDTSSFCSTLKLFTLKQILNLSKTDLHTFQTNVDYRNITWLHDLFEKFKTEKNKNERNIILPMPLIEIEEEYSQVNAILTDFVDEHTVNRLIFSCSTNQYLCYSFYLWFIRYYVQYGNRNFQPNDQYRCLFERNLSNDSKIFFQRLGIDFLYMLSTNFSLNSYFHLNPSMSDRDITIRLVILNIFALTLSFKSFPHSNWINTILFDTNSKMPIDYFQHIQSLCLFGLTDSNQIKTNMKYVRTSIKQQLNSGRMRAAGKYVYQCSRDCLYLFHFTHCGIPNQKNKCPFCGKDIGSAKYGVLIERDPPQIKMTVDEAFQLIDEYIGKINRENKFGYYEVIPSNQSTIEQKSDHLNNSITFRFLHLFIHSILFILKEFNYLTDENLTQWKIDSNLYFQNHIEKDYQLLEKYVPDSQYSYVWIFQLLNSMLNGFVEPLTILDTKEKVIEIEKLVEKQLIIPHSLSRIEDLNKYKRTYAEYTRKEETSNMLINFVDERTENERVYPFLSFFNVTQIFNQNQIEDFFVNLKTTPNAKTNYPLTMYLLERIHIWHNIQYLYPIIQFINYLRDKYNYRISREQAIVKSIEECFNDNAEELFKNFGQAWEKITFHEVRYGCQVRTFEKHMTKEKKLAFFSLNVSKDDSSLTLSATLQTIAKLQNDIVNYFHKEIIKSENIRCLPIHMIEKEHLLHLDENFINSKIIRQALVINFEYGQSKDLIYDYEEIEMTLRSLIHRLPLINIDKFRKIQYQFELYSENNALINDVRHHIKQKQINDDERKKYQSILQNKDENDILQYLGSLDCIFSYIQNRTYHSTISTIELFVKKYIHSKSFLSHNLFLDSTFTSVRLEYIIDLYELIEEIAFDKIFRKSIEEKLYDKTIDNNQQKSIVEKFLFMTIDNEQIAPSLHSINQWISTLKRFMVRILPDNIDLNIPIEIYLKRSDLWSCQITEDDIETIQLDERILLKHTFMILIGLENRLNESSEQRQLPIARPENQTIPQNVISSASGGKRRPTKSEKIHRRHEDK